MAAQNIKNVPVRSLWWVLSGVAAAALSACGGGQTASPAATLATQSLTLQLGDASAQLAGVPALAASSGAQTAVPTFHAAPIALDPPSGADATDNTASARSAAHVQAVDPAMAGLNTARLTLQAIESARHASALGVAAIGDGSAQPMASSLAVTTYTPAQIRAAYGLPALPAVGATMTAAQAAQLGAGQTIYIIDANHDPYAVTELNAFNQAFGLPACSAQAIGASTALPLPAASATSGCTFSVAYSTAAGGLSATAPAYDAGWATEITLDVQWSHATAPLARIVLIEAPDASLNSLIGAVQLANAMGPGVVSMSFGAGEGSWTSSVDAAFTHPGMTYLAATGDAGSQVCWPAVSANVLAVGGTSLSYTGGSTRAEQAWSGTGGGISQYLATPAYQNNSVPGLGALAHRAVPDVAFNADPNTGQYVAVVSSGSSAVGWLAVGGTSLATPQWAGLTAVANAIRAQSSKAALGDVHAALYGQIAAVAGSYAGAFLDITAGSDGSCATCSARVGYDETTGLGTPNATGLLSALSGATASAPVVSSASIGGTAGVPLNFSVTATSPDALTYTLTGAPAGMTIAGTGAVSWPMPLAGTYAVTVTAKDAKTGLSGQGVYTVAIATIAPPVVSSGSVSGSAGTPLNFNVAATSVDALTYTLSGAPAGMTIGSSGAVSWPVPVAGTYAVTVVAKDSKTGQTGQGVYTVTIGAAAKAPVVGSAAVSGKVGSALSFTVSATSPDPLTFTLSGAPAGMTIGSSGAVSWPVPVAGTYAVTAVAKDTKTALTGQGVYTVTIVAGAATPVVGSITVNGSAGTPLNFSVSAASPDALSYALGGAPSGMTIAATGLVNWPAPVAGTYSVTVVARDSKTGLSGQGVATVVIAAVTPPVVSSGSVSGKVGSALSFNVTATSPDPLTYTLTGAPSGMTIGSTGTVNWATPLAGTYSITVAARDAKNGLSGQGVYTVTIAAATAGPVVTASSMTGPAGKPLNGTITVSDPGASSVSVSITGVPAGVSFSVSGAALLLSWPNPVQGNYAMVLTARDNLGLSKQFTIPITITAK